MHLLIPSWNDQGSLILKVFKTTKIFLTLHDPGYLILLIYMVKALVCNHRQKVPDHVIRQSGHVLPWPQEKPVVPGFSKVQMCPKWFPVCRYLLDMIFELFSSNFLWCGKYKFDVFR